MKANKSAEAGFTIIETLIVLGIAGLIMLITFLALPAIERNSRNNQRKQDVAAILQAVSRTELNSSGNLPSDCTTYTSCVGQLTNVKLTYYNNSSGLLTIKGDSPGTIPTYAASVDAVHVFNYAKCDTQTTPTTTGAGYNDIVAIYYLETTGAPTEQCQEI